MNTSYSTDASEEKALEVEQRGKNGKERAATYPYCKERLQRGGIRSKESIRKTRKKKGTQECTKEEVFWNERESLYRI